MQKYQERVIEEKADLDGKIERLLTFVKGDVFGNLPDDEQGRMTKQLQYMRGYSDVLQERINVF